MKKSLVLLISLAMAACVSVSLLANPTILNFQVNGKKVHDAMKNGKKVNSCAYCHGTAGIVKKKQGFLKGQPLFATLKGKSFCAGSGCHH
jgi:cytochrome c553